MKSSFLRAACFCLAALLPLLTHAGAGAQELRGAVQIATDANGKIKSVTMRKSTGSKVADAKAMTRARVQFYAEVKAPRPNRRYIVPVRVVDTTGKVRKGLRPSSGSIKQ